MERDVADTDLFTFALGIAGGIGLGALAITIGGVTIGLGVAGGLLLTGLLIGFLRSIWPVFVGYFFSRKVLKLNPAEALGATLGGYICQFVPVPVARVVFAGLIAIASSPSLASESVASETTAPADAVGMETSMDQAFAGRDQAPARWPQLKKRLEDLPRFLRDAEVSIKPRSYYFDRETPNGDQRLAWALGGELAVRSGGAFKDRVSVGLSYYTSQRLHGPRDKGPTGVLQPDQDAINTLGQAYLQLGTEQRFGLRAYRQEITLPYINRNDSRMIPITHEAYLAGRYGTGRDLVVGHVRQQKNQASEEFVPLSQLAGAPGTHKGVSLIGAQWQSPQGWQVGAITQYAWDLFNTVYGEASWAQKFGDLWSVRTSIQYTDQRSVGDELVGDFDTYGWGWKGSVGYRNAILTMAFTEFDDDARLRSPFGSTPAYNSMIVGDFDRPGERALRVGFSYNLGRFGLPAWSGFANVVSGYDAEESLDGLGQGDRTEYDLTLDYKSAAGSLRGLWVRLRYAHIDYQRTGKLTDFRVIVNYDLPAL